MLVHFASLHLFQFYEIKVYYVAVIERKMYGFCAYKIEEKNGEKDYDLALAQLPEGWERE